VRALLLAAGLILVLLWDGCLIGDCAGGLLVGTTGAACATRVTQPGEKKILI
jgi:hypothetical protein